MKQWADCIDQQRSFWNRRMRYAAEDAPERVDIRAAADRQAKARYAAAPRFVERFPGIRGAIVSLIAVVVSESVGQYQQQPPRCSSSSLQYFCTVPHRSTEPGIRAWLEAMEALHGARAEVFVETLYGKQLYRRSPS
jgi:hypothetical protein